MDVYSFNGSYSLTRLDVELSRGEHAVMNGQTYDRLSRSVSGTEDGELVLKVGNVHVSPERNNRVGRETLELPFDIEAKSKSLSLPEHRTVLIAKPWWRDYISRSGNRSF